MNNKYKILIIEDDDNIQGFLKTLLEAQDYQTITAASGREGRMMVTSWLPDLVLLDLGLPDQDGQELLRAIRECSAVPVIVVSARDREEEKVVALDGGANDYITKPFGAEELLARVRAALRSALHRLCQSDSVFRAGDLSICYDIRRVYIGTEEFSLTQTEYNIVALLSQNTGKVMPYDAIIHGIWGANEIGSTKKLQVNMANIRRKMGIKPGENRYILTEMGGGYRLTV
ncbi:MAG: response regulator transcription factor [Clostridiales bacterium]|nr:response regulator transcription factor [Clostridiales bacterium]